MATKRINVNEITRDSRTQMREKELDPAVVSEYALAMENGDEFPDITVFSVDGKSAPYVLADGWYRTAATEKAYASSNVMIRANIRKGDIRDAILFAVGANSSHGVQRTNADKRKAVGTLLKDDEWLGWADTVIARRANVSQPFVSTMRRSLENVVDEKKGSSQNVLTTRPAKRKGLDGKLRAAPKQRKKTRRHPCRKCGCTDSKPCAGGCHWVEDDLCSSCAVTVTDKRRVDGEGNAKDPGPAPGMVTSGKKEKPIAELLGGKPLYIQFIFIPKVTGVTVSVSRGPGSEATRQTIATSELPRMPQPVLAQIVEQLTGKGK